MTAAVISTHPATIAHGAVLAALHEQCFDPPWDETAMVDLLSMPGASGLLACIGDAPVGLVLWRVAADEAEILTILVLPAHRGQGIGDRLVEGSLTAAAQSGACRMFLEVADSNTAAQALYARHGFTRVGIRRGYYQGQDAYVLSASLGTVTGT